MHVYCIYIYSKSGIKAGWMVTLWITSTQMTCVKVKYRSFWAGSIQMDLCHENSHGFLVVCSEKCFECRIWKEYYAFYVKLYICHKDSIAHDFRQCLNCMKWIWQLIFIIVVIFVFDVPGSSRNHGYNIKSCAFILCRL